MPLQAASLPELVSLIAEPTLSFFLTKEGVGFAFPIPILFPQRGMDHSTCVRKKLLYPFYC